MIASCTQTRPCTTFSVIYIDQLPVTWTTPHICTSEIIRWLITAEVTSQESLTLLDCTCMCWLHLEPAGQLQYHSWHHGLVCIQMP